MRFPRSKSARRLGPVLFALLLVVAAGCGSGDDTSTAGEDATTDTSAPAGEDATADASTEDEAEPSDDAASDDATAEDGQAVDGESEDGDGESEATDGESEQADAGAVAEDDSAAAGELFPDVLDATASLSEDGSWTFSATLSSPYDTPERYADAWRVVGAGGEVYGIRELAHDHASEQPFTRSQSGIEIPEDVTTVTVEGRDQVSGWGGATVEVVLER